MLNGRCLTVFPGILEHIVARAVGGVFQGEPSWQMHVNYWLNG